MGHLTTRACPPVYLKAGSESLGDYGSESGKAVGSSVRKSLIGRFRVSRGTAVCHAAAYGRVYRVCADAHQGRYRSKILEPALLPVYERGRGFCQGSVLCHGDEAGPGIRPGTGADQ